VVDLIIWRNVALLLLAVEAFLIGLPIALAFSLALRGMGQFERRIRLILPTAYERVRRAERITRSVAQAIVAPFIWASSVAAGVFHVIRRLTSKSKMRQVMHPLAGRCRSLK